MHALGRLGEPEDVASLIVWLLQPENDWVTGQVFGVDGGSARFAFLHADGWHIRNHSLLRARW